MNGKLELLQQSYGSNSNLIHYITSIELLFNSKLYVSVDYAGVLHYPTTILWLPVL